MDQKPNFCLYAPPLSSITSYKEMVDFAANHGISHLETLNILDLSTPDLHCAENLKAYADEKGITFPCVSVGISLVDGDSFALDAECELDRIVLRYDISDDDILVSGDGIRFVVCVEWERNNIINVLGIAQALGWEYEIL